MIKAQIICDSVSPLGRRLTTLKLIYPRFIHAELMTHRVFCLAGSNRLDFELPAGGKNGSKRVYSMSVEEFADKWFNGSAEGKASRFKDVPLNLDDNKEYTAKDITKLLGLVNTSNINKACRDGEVIGAYKKVCWIATGKAWKDWRSSKGKRRFSLRSRLEKMSIRQLNEDTKEITLSNITDVIYSGIKPVYKVITVDNKELIATKDHRVYTDSGWKRIEELIPNQDSIWAYAYGKTTLVDPYRYKKINGKWVISWNKSIRDSLAEKQGYKCYVSGLPLEKNFDVHHLIPINECPDLAFEENNVVAVNKIYHKQLHKKQGWQQGVPLISKPVKVKSIELVGETDTYDLTISGKFPNFFANGLVVHNSRNASSSRAEPVSKHIERIRKNAAVPYYWGLNQQGMQAKAEASKDAKKDAKEIWLKARDAAIEYAQKLADLGIHKQITNRLLEPFSLINVVMTATEWDNFFELRCHADAQPEMRILAEAIRVVRENSEPKQIDYSEWHLPFIREEETSIELAKKIKMSIARCARVSYLKHDNTESSYEDDLKLFNRLVNNVPRHSSPSEHVSTPAKDEDFHRNFRGWVQARELIEEAEFLSN